MCFLFLSLPLPTSFPPSHLPLSPSLPPSLSFPFSLFFPALPPGDVISRGSGFLNISWMSNRFHLEVHFWKISQCCLEDCVGRMSCNPWMLSVQAACHIYLLILLQGTLDSWQIPLILCFLFILCVYALSRVQFSVTARTIVRQAPLSMEFSRQEYWSRLPCPSPGDLPYPGIKLASLVSPALAHGLFTTVPPGKSIIHNLS